jgi:hypothetical protein
MAGIGGLGLLSLLSSLGGGGGIGSFPPIGVGGYGNGSAGGGGGTSTPFSFGGLPGLGLGSGGAANGIWGSPGASLRAGDTTIARTGPAGYAQGRYGTPYGYLGSMFGGSRNGGGNPMKGGGSGFMRQPHRDPRATNGGGGVVTPPITNPGQPSPYSAPGGGSRIPLGIGGLSGLRAA